MPRTVRRSSLPLIVTLACLALLLTQRPGPDSNASAHTLAAQGAKTWYRGNLHTHSLWSDGDDYPEMIAAWYRDHAYDFLAFTDHNVLQTSDDKWSGVAKNKGGMEAYRKLKTRFPENWIDERMTDGLLEVRLKKFSEVVAKLAEPGKFLLIQGEEITDKFGNRPVHMNGTNVAELITPRGGNSVYEVMQNNTDALVAQRERTRQPMLIHLNHPNFGYGVTAEDLMRVRGENFFEVYNGHPGVNNPGDKQHASTERIWDVILTQRMAKLGLPVMYGLATDDGHSYHKIPSRASEPGRGWVMVLATELTPASLIEALERGEFYSSSGVVLDKVTSSDKGLEIAVQTQGDTTYTIEFIGTRKGFDPRSEPVLDKDGKEIATTRRYSDDIGTVLQTSSGRQAKYTFRGDEIYVRARVTSSRKHPNPSTVGEPERAWSQPVIGPAGRGKSRSGFQLDRF
jgi:hypothetical protein